MKCMMFECRPLEATKDDSCVTWTKHTAKQSNPLYYNTKMATWELECYPQLDRTLYFCL